MNARQTRQKPRLEAEAAYENAHLVANDLLERIREQLFDLPAPGGELRIDWAHVGTVAEVTHRLAEIAMFLDT